MNDLLEFHYQCASCGEENESTVDPSGGNIQSYTEDCSVCCRPNFLRVAISADGEVYAEVEFSE